MDTSSSYSWLMYGLAIFLMLGFYFILPMGLRALAESAATDIRRTKWYSKRAAKIGIVIAWLAWATVATWGTWDRMGKAPNLAEFHPTVGDLFLSMILMGSGAGIVAALTISHAIRKALAAEADNSDDAKPEPEAIAEPRYMWDPH